MDENEWYENNSMDDYADGLGGVNNESNLVLLRPDIHKSFDNRWLVMVPKTADAQGTTGPSLDFVAHIIHKRATELWAPYHNVTVQYLDKSCEPYLFARFAWAILLYVKRFVTSGPRKVIRLHVSTTESGGKQLEYKEEFLTKLELDGMYGDGGSSAATSKSSKKRKSGTASQQDDESSVASSSTDVSVTNGSCLMEAWEERGRKQLELEKSSRGNYICSDSDYGSPVLDAFHAAVETESHSKILDNP